MLEQTDLDDKGKKSVVINEQALKKEKNVATVVVDSSVPSPIANSR